jgi:ferredoxin
MTSRFENFLHTFDEKNWDDIIHQLLPTIHEVDRDAVQIWFRFFPLSLFTYLQNAEDKAATLHGFAMQGKYELKDQIDDSHNFIYGHRFWGETKHAISNRVDSFDTEKGDIIEEIKQLSKSVAMSVKVDESVTTAIVLVGLMTLVQVGLDTFKSAKGETKLSANLRKKSAKQILEERGKNDSQGIFGFLKTIDKKWTVHFESITASGSFTATELEEMTTAAMKCDVKTDERCYEGPIPVECKAASCGTCWVGVVGGKDRLNEVSKLERKAMKTFGYKQDDEPRPFMRLACQAKVSGGVSVVIPAWNGVFGKKLYRNVEQSILEPATTSAKKLREVIATAVDSSQ